MILYSQGWKKKYCNLRQYEGFPGGISGRESIWQSKRLEKLRLDPRVRKIPWSRKQQPASVFLPGKFHGQSSLAGYSPWRRRVRHDWVSTHTQTAWLVLFSRWFMSLWPHGLYHTRLLCPPLSSRVGMSWWCYLTIISMTKMDLFCWTRSSNGSSKFRKYRNDQK